MRDREIRKKAGEYVPEKAFYPSNPSKTSTTAAHHEVAIGEIPYDTTSINYTGRERVKKDPEPRNLYLNPPQYAKAGYPLHMRTIGPPEPYIADIYEAGRALESVRFNPKCGA